MAARVAVESCEETSSYFRAGTAIAAAQAQILVMLGDDPYFNTGVTEFGTTIGPINYDSTQQNIVDRVLFMMRRGGWRDLQALRAIGQLLIVCAGFDDHRIADSFDSTLAAMQSGTGNKAFTPTTTVTDGVATQADANVLTRKMYAAFRQLANQVYDYPTAAQIAGPSRDVPPAVGLLANEIVEFTSVIDIDRNGCVGGRHARLIIPDTMCARSSFTATDDASKNMFGANLEAHILAQAKEAWFSGFQHVIICSTKRARNRDVAGRYGLGANSDTFGQYSTQYNRMMLDLYRAGVSVVWVSGDRHNWTTVYRPVGLYGDAFPSLDFSACPAGVIHNDSGEGRTYGQQTQRCFTAKDFWNVFGLLEFNDDDTLSLSHVHTRVLNGQISKWNTTTVGPRSIVPIDNYARVTLS